MICGPADIRGINTVDPGDTYPKYGFIDHRKNGLGKGGRIEIRFLLGHRLDSAYFTRDIA
jgi:hypothetical protein